MKTPLRIIPFLLFTFSLFAQEMVEVTAPKANLRGTPSGSGKIVSVVNYGERFELLKERAPWYLIQTDDYVGWIHGNGIRIIDNAGDDDELFDKDIDAVASDTRPRTTTKPPTTDISPFRSEYVGIDYTLIEVINRADRTLTLTFGGVRYIIPSGARRTIEADGGNYEYFATAPNTLPAKGVKTFVKGFKYSWTFWVSRTYR